MVVLAMAAHPDDIEFMMAGTLLLLKQAGAEVHVCNLANGCYGSQTHSKDETARIRAAEAQAAAAVAGAVWHPPLFDDLGIFYDAPSLAKVTAVVRAIKPDILLTLSRRDYMEDHEYAARLACSAAFNRCVTHYVSDPPVPAYNKPVAVYHVIPVMMMDMNRDPVVPDFVIGIGSVMAAKVEMLARHASQKAWLDATQGMNSYLESMAEAGHLTGMRYGGYTYAEGWRRHNHQGYCGADFCPLETVLAKNLKPVKREETLRGE